MTVPFEGVPQVFDSVDRPFHYGFGGVETIEALEASMTPEAFRGFLKGNVMKYVWRYENKNGLEDLKKAKWYLKTLIHALEMDEEKKHSPPLKTIAKMVSVQCQALVWVTW
jgi:hypothetical protein